MNKVTEAKIEAWKGKYDVIYELESGGKKGYIFDPICDFNVMKMVASAAQKGIQGMIDAVLNSCWLGGDEALKTQDAYRLGLSEEIADLIEMPEYKVETHGDHALVQLPKGEPVKLRLATRGDVKFAESRNKENKPFQTAVYLLDRIADDPNVIAEIRKDNRLYMGLLLAANEVKDKKYVAIKKL